MKALRGILPTALCLAALAAVAAPETSPRPVARGDAPPDTAMAQPGPGSDEDDLIEALQTEAGTIALAEAIAVARLRPHLRPPSEQALEEAALPEGISFASLPASIRPGLRPESIVEEAMARRRMVREGAVCGDLEIQGEEVGDVVGRIGACGIEDAVRLQSVSGLGFSQKPLMNCRTAKALKTWVNKGVKPAFGRKDKVVGLRVAAHYACRTRNNQPGGRISEHGKGNAIDISGFILESGKEISVLNDYTGKGPMRQARRAACGPFGTVLGPGSDRFHRDHFHLDTAPYRRGPYCK